MKDIEDRLQEEYDKVEVPDYMFDTSRVFKKVKNENGNIKKKIIYVAASLVVIILITVALVYTMPKLFKENEIPIEPKASQDNNIKGEITIKTLDSILSTTSDYYVLEIKVDKIDSYMFIDSIPYTKIIAKVLNSYYGDSSNEIEMYVQGGVFSVKDIKNNINNISEKIEKYFDEDKIRVLFNNEIMIAIPEEEKIYITTLNKVDDKLIVNSNIKYGFKEYDPETNIVKDDMGDEQLDIDRYLESINI